MRTAITILTVVSTLAAAAPAFAQRTDNAQCANSGAADSGSRDQTFCFAGETVNDAIVPPQGQASHVLRPTHGPSLLRIRAHFVPEMLKTVERL